MSRALNGYDFVYPGGILGDVGAETLDAGSPPGELLRLRVTWRRLPGLSASCYPGAASAFDSLSVAFIGERASDA